MIQANTNWWVPNDWDDIYIYIYIQHGCEPVPPDSNPWVCPMSHEFGPQITWVSAPEPIARQDLQQGTQLLGIQSCNCQDGFRTLAVLPTALTTDFHHWHLSGSVSHRKMRPFLQHKFMMFACSRFVCRGAGAVHEIVERLTGMRNQIMLKWNFATGIPCQSHCVHT